MIKVILVEDNLEYRESMSLILEHAEGINLISSFATAEFAIKHLKQEEIEQPDIILLDLRLPGMDGHAALKQFKALLPEVNVIIITQSNAEEDVLRGIQSGASGYLLKSADAQHITEAIKVVADDGGIFDPAIAKYILDKIQAQSPKVELEVSLSNREMDVMMLLADGLVKKEIAEKLSISYSTVDYHVKHIYEKLQVRNAPAAVNQAHRLGLLDEN